MVKISKQNNRASGEYKKKAQSTKKQKPPEVVDDEDREADYDDQEEDHAEEYEEFEGEADEELKVAEQPEDEEEEQEEETDPQLERRKRMMRNRKAKLVGYRNLAKAVGYLDKYTDDVVGSAGLDGQACIVSCADTRRCTRFVPATPGATTYGSDEFSRRHAIFKKRIPDSAIRVSQVYIDLVMRAALNDALMRTVEAGKKTISASMMQSTLRVPAQNMLFTAVVPPVGLVRFGQAKGLLRSSEADTQKKAEEKAEASKAKKMVAEYARAEEERLAAARKIREAKRAANAAA